MIRLVLLVHLSRWCGAHGTRVQGLRPMGGLPDNFAQCLPFQWNQGLTGYQHQTSTLFVSSELFNLFMRKVSTVPGVFAGFASHLELELEP